MFQTVDELCCCRSWDAYQLPLLTCSNHRLWSLEGDAAQVSKLFAQNPLLKTLCSKLFAQNSLLKTLCSKLFAQNCFLHETSTIAVQAMASSSHKDKLSLEKLQTKRERAFFCKVIPVLIIDLKLSRFLL